MPNDIDIYYRLKTFICFRLTGTLQALDPDSKVDYIPDHVVEYVSMAEKFQFEVKINKVEENNGTLSCLVVFIVSHDGFDEPLIDPVDAYGDSESACAEMAADVFCASVVKPLQQSLKKESPVYIPVDYLGQHYDFDMYARSVLKIGNREELNKEPTQLVDFLEDAIPKYLGSKKYYWLRISLAKIHGEKKIDIRLNGSVCVELPKYFTDYVENGMGDNVIEKQYAFFVQRADDLCPFRKETVTNTAKEMIRSIPELQSREEYLEMLDRMEAITGGDKCLASEIRVLLPEIFAKLLMEYDEGDSLILLPSPDSQDEPIEFRKTQLRSYFYMQQAVLEYLSTKPPQEIVAHIVRNSVACREVQKAIEERKKEGIEITAKDLHVPGTSFRVGADGYKVW